MKGNHLWIEFVFFFFSFSLSLFLSMSFYISLSLSLWSSSTSPVLLPYRTHAFVDWEQKTKPNFLFRLHALIRLSLSLTHKYNTQRQTYQVKSNRNCLNHTDKQTESQIYNQTLKKNNKTRKSKYQIIRKI